MDAQQRVTEASQIQCLVCGKWYRALPRHVRVTHGMSDDDYRIKHGVPKGTPLVCKEWSARARQVGKTDPRVRTQLSKHAGKGPPKGFKQSATAKAQRKNRDLALHRKGTEAAIKVDRTQARRDAIAPYPVTVSDVMERLNVGYSAASSFLSDCVKAGTVVRIRRGVYDLPPTT
jgi:hypothetical protein